MYTAIYRLAIARSISLPPGDAAAMDAAAAAAGPFV